MKQLNNNLLKINPSAETKKITSFIKTVLKNTGFQNVVLGMSGGIDSATSLVLLRKSIPPQNIFVAHLYYFNSQIDNLKPILKSANISSANIYNISIAPIVKSFQSLLNFNNRVRLGNIMARVRMIILYDLAKKHNALVCGTENKSEAILGYFTRFGDEASDFEPIQHLYKTQVYQLATYLKIPQNFIDQAPTAGLWHGQTDEGEFGFSYKEADNVFYLHFEKKLSTEDLEKKGFPNAKKIVDFAQKNSFKHSLPYTINKNPKYKITNSK